MTTALDVIKRAMRLAGVYSLGDDPSPEETENGLVALNGMIDSWANEALMLYTEITDAIPMVASTGTYTLGPTGTVVTERPIEALNMSYVVYQNVSYPCPLMTLGQYNSIAYKDQTQPFPVALYYESDYPNGTLTVYPVPSASSTLNFVSKKPLTSFATLTQEVNLPPGYFDALSFNLAVNFGPEFDSPSIPPLVYKQAQNAKRVIKRTNTKPLVMALPTVMLPQYGYVNWRVGA